MGKVVQLKTKCDVCGVLGILMKLDLLNPVPPGYCSGMLSDAVALRTGTHG